MKRIISLTLCFISIFFINNLFAKAAKTTTCQYSLAHIDASKITVSNVEGRKVFSLSNKSVFTIKRDSKLKMIGI